MATRTEKENEEIVSAYSYLINLRCLPKLPKEVKVYVDASWMRIFLAKGKEELLVYFYAASYRKPHIDRIGYQPHCLFAKKILEPLFELWIKTNNDLWDEQRAEDEKKRQREGTKIDRFKKHFATQK